MNSGKDYLCTATWKSSPTYITVQCKQLDAATNLKKTTVKSVLPQFKQRPFH